MSTESTSIADAITAKHLQFGAGQIEVWGAAAVRPNDQTYVIVSARASDNRVELQLEVQGIKVGPLTIHDPAGFSVTDERITIQDASRVTPNRVLDARNSAGQVEMTGSSGTHRRTADGKPALLLVS